MATVTFDPTAPEFLADPYPEYARLRDTDPVHWDERMRAWFLFRADDVEEFFHRSAFSADRSRSEKFTGERSGLRSIASDPPEHTAVRGLAARAFTPRQVEGLRPRVAAIVDELLDRLEDRRQFDVIEDFAYPFPITVIAEMFGVPEADRPQLQEWSREMARSQDHSYSRSRERGAMTALGSYFADLAQERRRRPGDDLVSRMLLAEDEGDTLTPVEVISLCAVLIFAGHETTTNLIGNGLLALLRHPDQLDRLRDDPGLVRPAVEELLRFDSPAQMISRALVDDVEVAGHTLKAGQSVLAVLGSANRDPARFADPDGLDLARDPNPHIAFGQGIHFCLGATLSRREAQSAFPALLRRFPEMRLAGEPVWRDTFVLRGLEHLPVAVG